MTALRRFRVDMWFADGSHRCSRVWAAHGFRAGELATGGLRGVVEWIAQPDNQLEDEE